MTYPFGATDSNAARQHAVTAVCQALGVPEKDWPLFNRWAASGSLNATDLDALRQYVDVMIADRCRRPGDDLISLLIQMEVNGQDLTADEIHKFVATLVARAG